MQTLLLQKQCLSIVILGPISFAFLKVFTLDNRSSNMTSVLRCSCYNNQPWRRWKSRQKLFHHIISQSCRVFGSHFYYNITLVESPRLLFLYGKVAFNCNENEVKIVNEGHSVVEVIVIIFLDHDKTSNIWCGTQYSRSGRDSIQNHLTQAINQIRFGCGYSFDNSLVLFHCSPILRQKARRFIYER